MTPPELRISLLGGFSAIAAGQPVPEAAWRLRKAKALVKLLALAPEHRLHRERAGELLWPDRDSGAATNNLHQALYVARRALEPAAPTGSATIELRDDVLTLCPATVDVEEFEQAAGEARGGGDLVACSSAVELYTGELLPEDRYEQWAAARREALRETFVALLLELAGIEGESGDSAAAVRWLQRALVEDPLHEEAHRRLMELFAVSGRRQQALAQYQQLRQALRREFEDVPDPETKRLYQSILSGSFGADGAPAEPEPVRQRERTAASAHNLPLRLTSFVGRERELAEVWRLVERGRLVTLTGPGGCGKTRLALETAAGRLREYPDGVWLADLAPLLDEALVPDAVAEALGLQLRAGQPPARALAMQLAPRRLMLLVDNCEHLVDAVARLADELLRTCPDLTILATSREPLHVPGELAWRVPSLSLPGGDEELAGSEAWRLFCERAAEASPGFDARGSEEAIAEICLRLDGMPLALELAAARARVLSPAQIAERLGDSLKLLAGGSRTALTRQQTLRATLEWSHDLLTEEERVLLRRLAVFSGSFGLDAVEGICAGDGIDRDQVLDLLERLVDKSLVLVDQAPAGPRYRLLETIRQYGGERLSDAGERAAVERRHLDWYELFASEQVPPPVQAVTGGTPPRLDAEHGNLRAALTFALRNDPDAALRLAVMLYPWWLVRSHFAEGARALHAALDRTIARTELRAEALLSLCALHVRLGDAADFVALGDEAVAIRRDLGDTRLTSEALLRVGQYAASIDPDDADPLYVEALGIACEGGDDFMRASITHARAMLDCYRSRPEDAVAPFAEASALLADMEDEEGGAFPATILGLPVTPDPVSGRPRLTFEETLLLFRPVPVRLARGYVLCNHAFARRGLGELGKARELVEEALGLWREQGDRPGIALALNQLGHLGRLQGEHDLAREWQEESLALRRELGDRRGTGVTLAGLGLLAGAAGEPDRGRLLLTEALGLFERTDDGPGQGGALVNLAYLELSYGDLEEARRVLTLSLPFWERQGLLRAMGYICLTLAELSPGEEGARMLERARGTFERLRDPQGLACIEGSRI